MKYKVLDTFSISGNTSVTIEGNGEGLKNNIIIKSDEGKLYKLLSIAMVLGEKNNTTTLLIEGNFNSNFIII